MSLDLLAMVWALVVLDCSLMGYRLSLGRSALLDQRTVHQRAAAVGAVAAVIPLAAVTALALWFVARGGPDVASAFDDAMVRFIAVGGSYALLIGAACGVCIVPSVAVRSAASVIVFGPMTLLRPVVVVLTVAAAVSAAPVPAVVIVGTIVAIAGVGIEPILQRRVGRLLVA